MPQAFQDLSLAKVWAGARVAPPSRFVVGTEGAWVCLVMSVSALRGSLGH